ncbi:hypothetical protein BDV96DRAFT_43585 [Lophiotrema nucula]|uniref:Uncharacterized protein n=1 Tax=Lophiotrema nucula TaxID=690887 RepID=A0A6A5Z9K0_9PLEO|nr:hypothetical protein BDV96DRAFT_43585 [Lophiotrema nucula]
MVPFCIVMNLTLSEFEQHAAALDVFSSISLLIHQYEKIDVVYQKREKDSTFENCLVDLFGKVLEREVMLVHYLKSNGFLKFLKAIPALDGWTDKKKEIDGLNAQYRSFLNVADCEDIVDIKHSTDELVDDK